MDYTKYLTLEELIYLETISELAQRQEELQTELIEEMQGIA